MPKDLRVFLESLKPDDILIIKREVDPFNFEVSLILQSLEIENKNPVTIFSKTKDLYGSPSSMPLIYNVFSDRQRISNLFFLKDGINWKQSLSSKIFEKRKNKSKPDLIPQKSAPVMEKVRVEGDIDLGTLPLPRHHMRDKKPELTMAIVLKDPESGFHKVWFVKVIYEDMNTLSASITMPFLRQIVYKYHSKKIPAPMAIILGHHPSFYIGSLISNFNKCDDYETICSFLNGELRLTKSQTLSSDFLIPADAEIIIEGEIPPIKNKRYRIYGQVTTGFYHPQFYNTSIKVTSILCREKPYLQNTFLGHTEHWVLAGLSQEGYLFNEMKKAFPSILSLHLPSSGCGVLSCYISVRKNGTGKLRKIAEKAFNLIPSLQWIVFVSDDIDVFQERDVLWSLYTGVNPKRDIYIKKSKNTFHTGLKNKKVFINAIRTAKKSLPERIKIPKYTPR